MNPGEQLKDALKQNLRIQAVNNCPAASVEVGAAIYGHVQNDDSQTTLKRSATSKDLAHLIGVNGLTSQTAVWHFMTDPIHHFVVIPWYDQSLPGWSYTLLMAYENGYTIRDYIQSAPGRMSRPLRRGYREAWSASELMDMLSALLNSQAAWGDYFLTGTENEVRSITCYKYKLISVTNALTNVTRY